MKVLIVYSSKYGNTERIAMTIANAFGNGARAVSVNKFKRSMMNMVDVIIVGSPTVAMNPSLSILYLLIFRLTRKQLFGVKSAAFDTGFDDPRAGSAANKIERRLNDKGAIIVVPAKRFIVTDMKGPLARGEKEKAMEWVNQIKQVIETPNIIKAA